MKKSYFIGPIAALIIFGAFYFNFTKDYSLKAAQKIERAKQEKEAKLKADSDARKKAVEQAVAALEIRKKEKAEKDRLEQIEKDNRIKAIETRQKSYDEQEKLARQVERLKKDVVVEQEAIAKLENTKKASTAELAFLKEYIVKANKNVEELKEVINKIAAAEKAREAAAIAAAAAEAAKKTS